MDLPPQDGPLVAWSQVNICGVCGGVVPILEEPTHRDWHTWTARKRVPRLAEVDLRRDERARVRDLLLSVLEGTRKRPPDPRERAIVAVIEELGRAGDPDDPEARGRP